MFFIQKHQLHRYSCWNLICSVFQFKPRNLNLHYQYKLLIASSLYLKEVELSNEYFNPSFLRILWRVIYEIKTKRCSRMRIEYYHLFKVGVSNSETQRDSVCIQREVQQTCGHEIANGEDINFSVIKFSASPPCRNAYSYIKINAHHIHRWREQKC